MTFKELLKHKGITQEELARTVDVSQSAVSAWCCGECRPNMAKLGRIAKALGVSVNKLVASFEQE